MRLNVVGNHGGLPWESTYGSLLDDDELEEFFNLLKNF